MQARLRADGEVREARFLFADLMHASCPSAFVGYPAASPLRPTRRDVLTPPEPAALATPARRERDGPHRATVPLRRPRRQRPGAASATHLRTVPFASACDIAQRHAARVSTGAGADRCTERRVFTPRSAARKCAPGGVCARAFAARAAFCSAFLALGLLPAFSCAARVRPGTNRRTRRRLHDAARGVRCSPRS